MEELEELKKELEEALEKVNKKLEEENDNKTYWVVDDWGCITEHTNDDGSIDKIRREIGNYFKTEKEAEEYFEDLKVKAEIKKIAKELNGDRKIDWGDKEQEKNYLTYSNITTSIGTGCEYSYQTDGVTYCLDENFTSECIDKIGYERLKKYLTRN